CYGASGYPTQEGSRRKHAFHTTAANTSLQKRFATGYTNLMIPSRSSQSFEAVHRWLGSPPGQALQQQDARIVEEAFDGIFGEQCLQLGLWGEARSCLKYPRIQRCASLADPDNVIGGERPNIYGQLHLLPVASDSVDAVILPHTLEFSDRPH